MRKVDPEQYEARRGQILGAAAICFRRDGYRGASMSSICAQAGMSPGHVYHYFKSKEEIIHAHVGRMLGETLLGLQQGFPNFDGPLVDRIAEWVCAVLRRMNADPDQRAMVLEIAAEAGRNPEVAAMLRSRIGAMVMSVSTLLRKEQERGNIDPCVDVEVVVLTVRSLVRGMLTPPMDDPQLFPEEEKCKMIRRVVGTLFAPKGANS